MRQEYTKSFSHIEVNHVLGLCRNSELLDTSPTTNIFDTTLQITKSPLKENRKTMVCRGEILPTISPLESLDYAEAQCGA